ncbi:MAG TPA: PH domain-containing protein [Candidatus Saccharimonadales bacterium]|nr:PH domain-containing protein [Candidatus Saccharimonadales bacterium]
MQPTAPTSDIPKPNPQTEEIVDPEIPAGNHIIIIIRRHPFGLVVQYLGVMFGLGLSYGLVFLLLPSFANATTLQHTEMLLSISAVVVAAFSALILLIGTALYRQNRWVVTDDSITQVLRNGIFGTLVSGLSMANIEDISSEQQGFFAQIFGFGTLKVETAGEQANKFHFQYCPKPENYAKILLDARQRFINENPEVAKRANDLLNVPGLGGQT